jgi:type VI secretion system protein ImpH
VDSKKRPTSDDLTWLASMQNQPYAVDLFAALRRIDAMNAAMPRLGTSLLPKDDPVRLVQQPDMAFAPSTVTSFRAGDQNKPPQLDILSFGLLGPNGPLPLHLTDYIRAQMSGSQRGAMLKFLDMFHHRLIALFYRAWASSRPTVHADRRETDRFQMYLGSLAGLAPPSLRARDDVSDAAKFHFAGQLVNHRRNAAGLIALLKDYFNMPMKLVPFVGHWMALPEMSRARLGESNSPQFLGKGAVIGKRVWDCQHKFRIEIGPISLGQYRDFLPGGKALKRLATWIRNYTGDEFAWDIRLMLQKSDVPQCKLDRGAQLGWTTWLGSRQPSIDRGDLLLASERAVAHG